MVGTIRMSVAVAMLVMLGLLSGAWFGCASSVASRASRESAQRLDQDDLDRAVAAIVEDLFRKEEFVEWRSRELAQEPTDAGTKREIVLILLDYVVQGADPGLTNNTLSGYGTRALYTTLRDAVRPFGMTFQRDMDGKGNNSNARMRRVNEQDNDPRFDQRTGKITTGRSEKVYVGLELEIQQSRTAQGSSGESFRHTIYAALVDCERDKDIVAGRADVKKSNP